MHYIIMQTYIYIDIIICFVCLVSWLTPHNRHIVVFARVVCGHCLLSTDASMAPIHINGRYTLEPTEQHQGISRVDGFFENQFQCCVQVDVGSAL